MAKDSFYCENLQRYEQALKKEKANNGSATDCSKNMRKTQRSLGIRDEDLNIVEGLVKNGWTIDHLLINGDSKDSYWDLMDALAKREWQKADAFTTDIILELANRKHEGSLDKEAIENFPSQAVYMLDRLWVEYSDGQFGFSVQKQIFDRVMQKEQKFGEEVKWRGSVPILGRLSWKPCKGMTFDLSAPKGHLPVWAAADRKLFTNDFLHLKIWDFKSKSSELSTNLVDNQEYYSEEAFWRKIKRFAKKAGKEVIEKVLTLYYAAQQPNIPLAVKLSILGALGYFILPIDLISDFIPVAGWTDDLGALGAALASAIPYVTPAVKEQVKKKMGEFFGK